VFASGGVIGTPSYFPMPGGGTGLAGEAGPETIMPLQPAADGSLGVAAQGGVNTIHVQIPMPDLDGFRRSESYVTGKSPCGGARTAQFVMDIRHDRFSRHSVSARYRAEERRRAGATHRDRVVQLRARGA
jgi:hypothetical protein